MKTHSHYTTPITAAPGKRWGAWALAALVVLLVGSLTLISALRLSRNSTAAIPAALTRPAPIASCRACRDEWITAMQPSRVSPMLPSASSTLRRPAPAPVLATTRQQITVPRVFRDEVLGAAQANLGSVSLSGGAVVESEQSDLGESGPR
jgi:hypothetical protein